MYMVNEYVLSRRCNGLISGVVIFEHMEFTQLQKDEAHAGGFGKKDLHILHLNSNQLLVEDSCIPTVRLIHQLRRLLSVVYERDFASLPLILTSFATHGVIH